MKSSRVLILPSHSEGVAKAMLEALACGLHVIVSELLRVPEDFVDHVIRVNLEDWPLVEQTIAKCNREGVSHHNIAFVNAYLESSILRLDKLYQDLSMETRPNRGSHWTEKD